MDTRKWRAGDGRPRLTAGGNSSNGQELINTFASSYYVHNGDYFRVKNVSLSYNLPYRWLRRSKLGSVKSIRKRAEPLDLGCFSRDRPGSIVAELSPATRT